jgi:hypothetical protein
MVAGREVTPKDAANTDRLKEYWAHGAGARLINWGVPGDFDRCITQIQTAVTKGGSKPLDDAVIKGLCANLHHEATGGWPGHAPGVEEAQSQAKHAASVAKDKDK